MNAKLLKQSIETIQAAETEMNVEILNKKNLPKVLEAVKKKIEESKSEELEQRLCSYESKIDRMEQLLTRLYVDSIPIEQKEQPLIQEIREAIVPPTPTLVVSWSSKKLNEEVEVHKCSNGHEITVTKDLKTAQFTARIDSGPAKVTNDLQLKQMKKQVELMPPI